MTLKIVHLSDTHFAHEYTRVPEGDILIHTGDALSKGSMQELSQFARWMQSLSHKYKIYVPGNHDEVVEKRPDDARAVLGPEIITLINESVEIEGQIIWGSPYTPFFNNWSFMKYRGPMMEEVWEQMPDKVDILLTHGPPWGILDQVPTGMMPNVGCEDLRKRVLEVKPRIHLFGHIHEGYGMTNVDRISFYNSSIQGDIYEPLRDPQVIEYTITGEKK